MASALVIGINNRTCMALEVDSRLMALCRGQGWRVFLVAESGVHSREDAMRMMRAGADALLVGTELMERPGRLSELNRF